MKIIKVSKSITTIEVLLGVHLTRLNKSSRRREVLSVRERMNKCRLLASIVGEKCAHFDYNNEMSRCRVDLKILKLKHDKTFYAMLDYFKPQILSLN